MGLEIFKRSQQLWKEIRNFPDNPIVPVKLSPRDLLSKENLILMACLALGGSVFFLCTNLANDLIDYKPAKIVLTPRPIQATPRVEPTPNWGTIPRVFPTSTTFNKP